MSLNKRYTRIYSPAIGRDMSVLTYGHWGPALLVFPSSGGAHYEWEDFGMIDAIGGLVADGKLKVYCPESLDVESWFNRGASGAWRAFRHRAYEDFILSNLVPAIRFDCRDEGARIAATGVSFGAYHAANFALKFPHVFNWALCMSGIYDISQYLFGGWSNEDVYFNNPLGFMHHMHGGVLDHVRRNTHLVLVCGQGAWEDRCLPSTRQLAGVLRDKGVSHELDIWGGDTEHHWYWWKRQAPYHLARVVG